MINSNSGLRCVCCICTLRSLKLLHGIDLENAMLLPKLALNANLEMLHALLDIFVYKVFCASQETQVKIFLSE